MHGVIGSTLDTVNFHKPLDTPDIDRPYLMCIIADCMFVMPSGKSAPVMLPCVKYKQM